MPDLYDVDAADTAWLMRLYRTGGGGGRQAGGLQDALGTLFQF